MTNPWQLPVAATAGLFVALVGCSNPTSGGTSSSSSSSGASSSSSSSGVDTHDSGSSSSGGDSSSSTSSSSGGDTASSSGNKDTAGSSSSGATTYAALHPKLVLASKCSDGYCHNIAAGGLELSYTDVSASYKALLNGKATGLFKDDCKAQKYVVPGKPEQSLLWLKVDKKAVHGCGSKMPPDPKPGGVSADLSAAVKAWILAGAKP